ncbi:hypothetical protein KGF54_000551 [Candida jiufengensis]|uniref:uncharacterized protein n=1 Tax=Candida jiufengensis TaxID=497108 RepID=UPI00222448B0|nr:uncharacterized protein KGF54_000551 [Candida jiufengensis]KAI5956932.1 hypothetical protein KGF54_000551 [Candida jiufengensis]
MTSSSYLPSTTSSPVITGHRGFKGKYPENTLVGFEKCFNCGAKVIETDLYLSSDNVIVISHDLRTKRVFVDSKGNETDYKITDTPYSVLKELKTKNGNYPLLSFVDLLTWFKKYINNVEDANEYKLQLDIKKLNPTKILKYLVLELLKIHDNIEWWYNKLQLGIWDLNFLKYLNQNDFFQDYFGKLNKFDYYQFDIFHISVNWRDSINYINYNYYLDEFQPKDRKKIKLTGVSLIYISTWSSEFLTKFIPLLKLQNLKFYSWTINNKFQFEYLVKIGKLAKLVEYGVISDFPDQMVALKNEEILQTETKELLPQESYYYNEDGDLNIQLTLKQKLFYWLYLQFTYLNGSQKKIRLQQSKFSLEVDENHVDELKINPFIAWTFQTCQKYGIF